MHREHGRRAAVVALCLLGIVACDDETEPAGGGGQGGAGGQPTSTTGGSAEGGAGGEGGQSTYVPTAQDVQFQAVSPMPLGEWLLFNDWTPEPNELLAMRPDGTDELTVFRAYRIWSMTVSTDQNTIAFSAGDPEQEAHYGLTIGDSIQPTFLYDALAESASNLTFGNINDECHRFSKSDAFLYLCRRYDFEADGTSKGYRIARVDIATKELTWITELDSESHSLNPEPTDDETQLYFTRIGAAGKRRISRAPLPTAENEETFRDEAGGPRLSPDGTRMLFQDASQEGAIVALNLESMESVVVAEGPDLSTARWSPDGERVAFLRFDDDSTCSHVEVARADGSEADSAVRVHDCATSGRFVTELEWIKR